MLVCAIGEVEPVTFQIPVGAFCLRVGKLGAFCAFFGLDSILFGLPVLVH